MRSIQSYNHNKNIKRGESISLTVATAAARRAAQPSFDRHASQRIDCSEAKLDDRKQHVEADDAIPIVEGEPEESTCAAYGFTWHAVQHSVAEAIANPRVEGRQQRADGLLEAEERPPEVAERAVHDGGERTAAQLWKDRKQREHRE